MMHVILIIIFVDIIVIKLMKFLMSGVTAYEKHSKLNNFHILHYKIDFIY